MVTRKQASEEEVQGHNMSVVTMTATVPPSRVASGEILTVDTMDMLTRRDVNWLPPAAAARLRDGKHITLRIRSTTTATGADAPAHWHAAIVQRTKNGMAYTVLDSQPAVAQWHEWWAAADALRETLEAAAAGEPITRQTASYQRHELSAINARGDIVLDAAALPPSDTIGGVWQQLTQATSPPSTVLTSLGAWPATTRLEHFGHTTGIQNEGRGAEGTLILRTDATPTPRNREGGSPRRLAVHLAELERGGTTEHRLSLSAAEWEHATAADIAHLVAPDWCAVLLLTRGGSKVLHQPDKHTMAQLDAHASGFELQIMHHTRPQTPREPPAQPGDPDDTPGPAQSHPKTGGDKRGREPTPPPR